MWMRRSEGEELSSAWEAAALPLSYTRARGELEPERPSAQGLVIC